MIEQGTSYDFKKLVESLGQCITFIQNLVWLGEL